MLRTKKLKFFAAESRREEQTPRTRWAMCHCCREPRNAKYHSLITAELSLAGKRVLPASGFILSIPHAGTEERDSLPN